MSIASAIAALSPQLWWKLDEGGGSTANNSGSLANNGTVSGSVQWDILGPEIGTTAIRLFTGGQVLGLGMDVGALGSYTIAMWVSSDGTGVANGYFPIVSIGDAGNRMVRGLVLGEIHSTIGETAYRCYACPTTSVAGTPSEPRKFWHWVVFQASSGTNGIKMYLDGGLAQQTTPIQALTPALSTDPILLRCNEPVALAHVCFWNGVLTQTQIQSVSSQLAPWPYTVPINTPPPAAGGGGLTEAQAEQLGQIDAKTDDIPGLVDAAIYISGKVNEIDAQVEATAATVNAINGKVDEALAHLNTLLAATGEQLLPNIQAIQDAVTRMFITGAGLGLSTPLGSLLAHPDPNLLHAANEEFVISGRGELVPPGPLAFGNVYGVRWTATTVPPRAGLYDGIVPRFTRRLVQFVLWYTDVGDLDLHAQEIEEHYWRQYTWLWRRPFPNTIQYDVCPGFELTCRYILLAPIEPP